MPWGAYIFAFFFATIKFLFVASATKGFYDISAFEIFVCITLGGLFSFNFCYLLSAILIEYARKKRLRKLTAGIISKKKNFTQVNKFLVRMKGSKRGLIILSTLGTLFLSIPLSGVILAKFYHRDYKAYFIACTTIIVVGFFLAYANDYIFNRFL
ncbi:MAG: hypothetical protein ACI8Q1_001913 [Parvicella sp.]|jgi:hypothetical protein